MQSHEYKDNLQMIHIMQNVDSQIYYQMKDQLYSDQIIFKDFYKIANIVDKSIISIICVQVKNHMSNIIS